MNIRELSKKWQKQLITNTFDVETKDIEHYLIWKKTLDLCVKELEQVLASCEAEVDRELNESRQYCEPEFTAGLVKAKKIYGGEKCSSVKQE